MTPWDTKVHFINSKAIFKKSVEKLMLLQIQRKFVCSKLSFLKAMNYGVSVILFIICFVIPQLTDALKKNSKLADIAGEENIKVIVERFR